MTERGDPTTSMRELAATFPSVIVGTSCNQTSFKVGKNAFLYLGPGPKGKGFKAMFKLDSSMNEAKQLAVEEPDRFEVGATGWVTTRFSEETPLPKTVWQAWLRESYELSNATASSAGK